MMQRALLAPMVWILMTLLDGKCFICAFSMNVDPKYFTGIPNSTGLELIKIMAKVPCKEDIIFKNSSFRKAISRYVRCYSQVSVFFSLFLQIFYMLTYLFSQWTEMTMSFLTWKLPSKIELYKLTGTDIFQICIGG